MPNSVLWICLVAVWLFVLVPMVIKGRPQMKKTTDATRDTRLVHRGGTRTRTVRRASAGAHPHDPEWKPTERATATRASTATATLITDDDADDADEVDVKNVAATSDSGADDKVSIATRRATGAKVPAPAADSDDSDDSDDAADSDDVEGLDDAEVEADEVAEKTSGPSTLDPVGVTAVIEHGTILDKGGAESDEARVDEDGAAANDLEGEADETGKDDDLKDDDADADLADDVSDDADLADEDVDDEVLEDADYDDDEAELDDDELEAELDDEELEAELDEADDFDEILDDLDDAPSGRGDAAADAPRVPARKQHSDYAVGPRAQLRYRARQRVLIALVALLVVSIVAGVFAPMPGWIATGVVVALIVGYLFVLRRAVRTEERLRAQRAARMQRTRREEAERRRREEQEREFTGSVPTPRLRRPGGAVVLEIDDEDPVFEHLRPVPGARIMREDAGHRRAAAG